MSYASTVPVAPAAIVPGITRFLERVLAATVEARRRSIAHRQYRHLLEIDDRLLEDAGISRSDVRQALRSL
jgi:uncharacterized protein YjiS (DUF1127 family)